MPINYGSQIHVAVRHWYIRKISRPNKIWAINSHPLQQIWVDLMLRMRFARVRTWDCPLKVHDAHQSLDPFFVHFVTLTDHPCRHFSVTVIGGAQVLLINNSHVVKVLAALTHRLVVVTAAPHIKQFALPRDAYVLRWMNHFFALRSRTL